MIRRGKLYHVVPEDEYFRLMRGQEKMSKVRYVRCCVQKIKRHTKYVSGFKQSYSVVKKSLIAYVGGGTI